MDMRQLRYFILVAEKGGILKAAASVGLTQPAFSRQIRRLEEDLGTTLLLRNSRGVTITEPGSRLLQHARSIIASMEKARAEVSASNVTPTGKINFAVTPSVGSMLVPTLIRRFRSLYPSVSLRVMEGLSGDVYQWLISGRTDVGVIYHVPSGPSLIVEPLLVEDLYLVGPVRDPKRSSVSAVFDELGNAPLILPSHTHALRRLLEELADTRGIRLNVIMEVDSTPAIKELIESGLGYSILPFGAFEREVNAGILRATRLTNPPVARKLVVATAAARPLSRAGRELARHARLISQELVREGKWPGRLEHIT